MPRKASAPAPAPRPARTSLFSRTPVVIAILATMLVCAAYLWIAQPVPPASLSVERSNTEAPSGDVVARVSRFIVTNPSEEPQVFAVSDPSAFAWSQPGIGQVQTGDKVLIWSDKMVVYSPTLDKIVAVVPTSVDSAPSPQAAKEAPLEASATVEVRNGSGVAGAAARLKKTLTDAGLTVSGVGDAATRPSGTVVVDLSGGTVPNALAASIKAADGFSGELPAGEPTSKASILIIIGR